MCACEGDRGHRKIPLSLHGLEERGYLSSTEERSGSAVRRVYYATQAGEAALAAAKLKVREFFGELFEDDPT